MQPRRDPGAANDIEMCQWCAHREGNIIILFASTQQTTHLTTGISQRTRAVVPAVVPPLEHGNDLVEEDGALLWSAAVNLDLQRNAVERNVQQVFGRWILRASHSLPAAVWSWC
jgi:hypothetical protein